MTQTFTVVVTFGESTEDTVRISILPPNNPSMIEIYRHLDWAYQTPVNVAQAGIEQLFDLGPGSNSGNLCHGHAVKFASNNNGGPNVEVLEFDYDS